MRRASRWGTFGRSLRLVTLVCLLCAAAVAQAASVWFADAAGLHRVDTDTNSIVRNVAQPNVVALTLDQKDGSLWATDGGTLFKYDADGAPLLALDLKSVARNFNAATRLALDPSDDSVWVAGGNNIARIAASGQVLATAASTSSVQDIALAQDESLWVLGTNDLSHYAANGALLGSASIAGDLQQAIAIALDDTNGNLWLAGAKSVYQLAPALPIQRRLTLALNEVASAMALATDTGTLWVAGQSSVFRFDRTGAPIGTTALAPAGISNLRALQVEPQSQSAWLGHEKGVTRLDAAGNPVATLPASVAVRAVSSAPSGIVPIVTLVTPRDATLTRDAFIPIRVHYDASCFGRPCGFTPDVFAAYTLTATLNGRSIGGAFVFDPATDDAVFTPRTRDDEGLDTFTAYVTDGSGRRSRSISSTFTVDTVAPQFVSIAPPNGSLFLTPGITLSGSVDDPTASVLLQNFTGSTVIGPNPAGAAFSWAITLVPGPNVLRLTAADPAGNASTADLTYTYNTLALVITSPGDGAIIDADHVAVTGTFSGADTATITVNGVPASISGHTFAVSSVPLVFGTNTITAAGVAPGGAQATRSITVTSSAPSITIATPANGASVVSDTTLVTGQVSASPGAGVVVNNVAAVVQGNTFYANGVHLDPGVTTITATVKARSGASASASVNVTSTGPAPVAVIAAPVEGLTPLTVNFTIDNRAGVPLTSFGLDPGGFGNVATPTDPAAFFAFTYPQAGTYVATLTLFDSSGNAYPQAIAVQVRDVADMDAMFRALWKGMNDALVAGDKDTAMTYLSAEAKDKYGPVFDKLLPHMADIVASYSALQRHFAGPGLSVYAINRTINGVNRIFLITFIQDESGAWLIDAM